MFTGIVEAVGRVAAVEGGTGTHRVRFEAPTLGPELRLGDSVSVDGACLTVTEADPSGFAVDVIGTTLDRTIAGRYRPGSAVNLERALAFGGRIDGHLVQGHVDGLGELVRAEKAGGFWMMDFRLPSEVAALTLPRGSVALNGVSLTVAELLGEDVCRVGIIPHTYAHTNLGGLAPGDPVNVEGDLIGKYVGRVLEVRR